MVLLGTALLLGVILVACGGKPEPTFTPVSTEPPTPTQEPVAVPNLTAWESSAHNAVDTEPFCHWDKEDPAEVPVACAKCHTSAGYQDYLGADGSTPNVVDKPVPAGEAQGIQFIYQVMLSISVLETSSFTYPPAH